MNKPETTTLSQPMRIVCPHCQATNRLPPAHLTEQPKCGKCHQPLFTAHSIEFTTITFELQATRVELRRMHYREARPSDVEDCEGDFHEYQRWRWHYWAPDGSASAASMVA